MSRTTSTQNLQSPQPARFEKYSISQARCPLPKLYSFTTRSEIVPEAVPVWPHKQSIISVPPCKQGYNNHNQFLPAPVVLDKVDFSNVSYHSLVRSPQTQLAEKWITFQIQSFFWNNSKGTERFPKRARQTSLQAQPVTLITYSTFKDLVLTAVLIHNEFFESHES